MEILFRFLNPQFCNLSVFYVNTLSGRGEPWKRLER